MQCRAEPGAVIPVGAALPGFEWNNGCLAGINCDVDAVMWKSHAVGHVTHRLNVRQMDRHIIAFMHLESLRDELRADASHVDVDFAAVANDLLFPELHGGR